MSNLAIGRQIFKQVLTVVNAIISVVVLAAAAVIVVDVMF